MAKKVVLKDNSGNKCYPVTRDECILYGNKTLPEKFSEIEEKNLTLSKNVSTISRYSNIVFTANDNGSVDINITDSNSNYFSALGGYLMSLPMTDGAINVPNTKALYLNEKTNIYNVGNIGEEHPNEVLIAFIVSERVALGLLRNAFINSQIDNKQEKLISGTNIKTVNGQPILGAGDIEINGDITLNAFKALQYSAGTMADYDWMTFEPGDNNSLNISTTSAYINMFTAVGGLIMRTPVITEPINIPQDKGLFLDLMEGTYSVGNIGSNTDKVLMAYNHNSRVELGLLRNAFRYYEFKKKQDVLISGTNIKTINGQPILGAGDIEINGDITLNAFKALQYSAGTMADYDWMTFEPGDNNSLNISTTSAYINMFTAVGGLIMRTPVITEPINIPQDKGLFLDLMEGTYSVGNIGSNTDKVLMAYNHNSRVELGLLRNAFRYYEFKKKQDVLISGTNIKTINGQPILGAGDIEISANVNPYKGKKVLVVGDSITAYPISYTKQLFELLQPSVGYRRGVYGSAIADNSSPTISFCERVDLPADDTESSTADIGMPTEADLVILFGGVNDWGTLRNQQLGTIEEGVNRKTFYGGLHYVISALRGKYPNAKFVVINLHHINNKENNHKEIEYTVDFDIKQGFTYSKNNTEKTYSDYRTAIKSVAELYGCQVIDLFNVGFSYLLEEDYTRYSSDGLHPNEEGGNKIATYIYSQITY